jgi:hypothetical protein
MLLQTHSSLVVRNRRATAPPTSNVTKVYYHPLHQRPSIRHRRDRAISSSRTSIKPQGAFPWRTLGHASKLWSIPTNHHFRMS